MSWEMVIAVCGALTLAGAIANAGFRKYGNDLLMLEKLKQLEERQSKLEKTFDQLEDYTRTSKHDMNNKLQELYVKMAELRNE